MGSATEGPQLTAEQAAAVDQLLPALRNGEIGSLIGPAGSGKSFTLGHLLRALEVEGLRCLVATPTHKAARVCREFLAGAGAAARVCTVASLLKLRPSLDRDGRIQFATRGATEAASALRGERPDLIVVDESSMLNNGTATDLWALAQEVEAGLLLVGDRAQLPPVNSTMAALFLDPPGVRSELVTVRRNSGAVLQLATSLRQAQHPSLVWPTASSPAAQGGSRIVLHQWQSGWLAAAARAICNEAWDADPDGARVIAWANRTAASLGQRLREQRYGAAAARDWQIGEILIAPGGIQSEGSALAAPQAAACSEFRILALEAPTRLEHLLGVHPWLTPTRQLERELEVAAGTDAQRAQVENIVTGDELEVWLEPPGGVAESWGHQCREVRNSIRQHLDGGDRKKALAEVADLESIVPVLRQAAALTCHSSQGSSFRSVFVADDLRRCDGPEARALSYVACSRASEALHLLPMPRFADRIAVAAVAPQAVQEAA
ncbi:AAA family ATPase [Cyanobium sp. BA20m-p-22]|uniref:AAA family ATPase n=1 Tax=Cyanobium sp. BA20m-p-22 TaxID=2823704 RepID=UPI0020CFD0CF|nr:AAA family ATPase [Cyanobium sp. BA20m-p-22]MCP9910978.1 AAA family ATPase [Cyanobium sp. BA20m-p-22]